jgi:hypothetical protein
LADEVNQDKRESRIRELEFRRKARADDDRGRLEIGIVPHGVRVAVEFWSWRTDIRGSGDL